MIFDKIRNITSDDISWLFKFGPSKLQRNIIEIRANDFKEVDDPVFFLSTGRTGTMWFTKLLQHHKKIKVFHRPIPDLAVQNKFVYEIQKNNNISDELKHEIIKEVFITGREQYLRYSVKTGRRYIETNNCITFFAPSIAKLLPKAKFIHLYRHPGEFVRSGLRRGYYKDTIYENLRRIIPVDQESHKMWMDFTQLQKTAWLWNETNHFIEHFKKNINPERILSFNFNDLTIYNINKALKFLNISLNHSDIVRHLVKKENVQKNGMVKEYHNWDMENRIQLKRICEELAIKYNYDL